MKLAGAGLAYAPAVPVDARGCAVVNGDRWRVLVTVAQLDELHAVVGPVRFGDELLARAQAVGCWPGRDAWRAWCELRGVPLSRHASRGPAIALGRAARAATGRA